MSDRYHRTQNLDFGHINRSAPAPRKKKDPLDDLLRFGATVAPYAGTAIGGLVGGLAGGGAGAVPGMAIGGAAGSAAGAGLNAMSQDREAGEAEDEQRRLDEEEERRARSLAAMQMLGSMG